MLYLEDEREAKLFEITGTKGTEVEQALKIILEEFDDIVSQGVHDIENCQTIEHAIRLLDETPVVGKKDRAGEGMDRLCINYAPLNKRTILDRYSLPNINEMLSSFWRSK